MKNIVTFTNTKTGEVELKAECSDRITFDSFEGKESIGKLKGKLENGKNIRGLDIDVYTIGEDNGKIIINNNIELEVCK